MRSKRQRQTPRRRTIVVESDGANVIITFLISAIDDNRAKPPAVAIRRLGQGRCYRPRAGYAQFL